MTLSRTGMAQLVMNDRGYLQIASDCAVNTLYSSWWERVRCAMGYRGWGSACAGVAGGGRVS